MWKRIRLKNIDMISERLISTDLKELRSADLKFWIDCWSFRIIVLKIVGFRWCPQSGPSSSPENHPKFVRNSPKIPPEFTRNSPRNHPKLTRNSPSKCIPINDPTNGSQSLSMVYNGYIAPYSEDQFDPMKSKTFSRFSPFPQEIIFRIFLRRSAHNVYQSRHNY